MKKYALLLAAAIMAGNVMSAQKIASIEIAGEPVMTFGADPNTPFANEYRLIVKDAKGDTIDVKSIAKNYSVTWDIDGFRTENDLPGQYCDSYGSFSTNGSSSLNTIFELRDVPMNFVGRLTSTLRIGNKEYKADKYVCALGNKAASAKNAADDGIIVNITAETGKIYNVTVAYTGALNTGRINDDLAGYELGRQAQADTVTFEVPCVNGCIDLWATAADGISPRISYVSIARQDPKARRSKRKLHHIGDSTSANKGSWAHRLFNLLKEGKYEEVAALCDFCNDGAGGRNLSTYYAQARLAKVLLDIAPGDVVMIGNNGTNGMNRTFEDDLNHYINLAQAFGAEIILNSYTPHGAVSRWEKGYNAETQRFDSYRRDAYDVATRKVAEERKDSDAHYIGFVEIGQNADAIFNAYVDDYAKHGYKTRQEAARAIVSCFSDHNHYSRDTLACDLMLNGYAGIPGITTQIVRLLSK